MGGKKGEAYILVLNYYNMRYICTRYFYDIHIFFSICRKYDSMFPFDCYNRKLLSHTTRKSIYLRSITRGDIDSTRYIFYLRIFKKKIDIFFFFFILLHFQKIVSTSFYITVIYFHFKCTKCPVTCGWQYSRIIAFQPWYHLHIPLYCRSIILFTGIKAYRRVINELSFTVHRFLRLPPRNSSPKILQRYSKKIHAKKTFEISSFLSSFQFSIQNVQSSEVEIEDHFKFVSRRECCRLNYFLSQV